MDTKMKLEQLPTLPDHPLGRTVNEHNMAVLRHKYEQFKKVMEEDFLSEVEAGRRPSRYTLLALAGLGTAMHGHMYHLAEPAPARPNVVVVCDGGIQECVLDWCRELVEEHSFKPELLAGENHELYTFHVDISESVHSRGAVDFKLPKTFVKALEGLLGADKFREKLHEHLCEQINDGFEVDVESYDGDLNDSNYKLEELPSGVKYP